MKQSIQFFGTCLIDLLYPRAGLAAMTLLRDLGQAVSFPRQQTCCGQPAWNSGQRDQALAVARAQLAGLRGDGPILLPSASCAGMFRKHWPRLFAGQPDEAQAKAISSRVFELCEFLVDQLDFRPRDQGEPVRVVVHHSCSARRELGVAPQLAEVLARLDKVETVEPEMAEECCGFGGTFSVKQPAISGDMVGDKTRHIRATGAEILVSQDFGCLMNIGGALAKQGTGPRPLHIAEFLLQRTDPTAFARLSQVTDA